MTFYVPFLNSDEPQIEALKKLKPELCENIWPFFNSLDEEKTKELQGLFSQIFVMAENDCEVKTYANNIIPTYFLNTRINFHSEAVAIRIVVGNFELVQEIIAIYKALYRSLPRHAVILDFGALSTHTLMPVVETAKRICEELQINDPNDTLGNNIIPLASSAGLNPMLHLQGTMTKVPRLAKILHNRLSDYLGANIPYGDYTVFPDENPISMEQESIARIRYITEDHHIFFQGARLGSYSEISNTLLELGLLDEASFSYADQFIHNCAKDKTHDYKIWITNDINRHISKVTDELAESSDR
jgi:hypothetical protein